MFSKKAYLFLVEARKFRSSVSGKQDWLQLHYVFIGIIENDHMNLEIWSSQKFFFVHPH